MLSAALGQALGGEDRNQPPWELPGEGKFELSPEDLAKLRGRGGEEKHGRQWKRPMKRLSILENPEFFPVWRRDGRFGQRDSQGHIISGMGGGGLAKELGLCQWDH